MTATILQFPRRNKGRVRKSDGLCSEGVHSAVRYGSFTNSVEVFNLHRADAINKTELLGYLTHAIINCLPRETKDRLKLRAKADASLGDTDTQRIAATLVCDAFKTFA